MEHNILGFLYEHSLNIVVIIYSLHLLCIVQGGKIYFFHICVFEVRIRSLVI